MKFKQQTEESKESAPPADNDAKERHIQLGNKVHVLRRQQV
jgi:hypothetical protein